MLVDPGYLVFIVQRTPDEFAHEHRSSATQFVKLYIYLLCKIESLLGIKIPQNQACSNFVTSRKQHTTVSLPN